MKNILLNGDFRSGGLTVNIGNGQVEDSAAEPLADNWTAIISQTASAGTVQSVTDTLAGALTDGVIPEIPSWTTAKNCLRIKSTDAGGLQQAAPSSLFLINEIPGGLYVSHGRVVQVEFSLYAPQAGRIQCVVSQTRNATETTIFEETLHLVSGWNRIQRSFLVPALDQDTPTELTSDKLTFKLALDRSITGIKLDQIMGTVAGGFSDVVLTGVSISVPEDEKGFSALDELTRSQIITDAAPATGVTTSIDVLALIGGGAYYTLVIEDGIITSAALTTP